jgi:mannitol-1-/sugar-/sorbitol-6-/2-deoxyglucose-6-phosphatase
MARPVEAVVFDMDGVLIDSEPTWRQIERDVFAGVGIELTDQELLRSMGVRIDQVVAARWERQPWEGPSPREVEEAVLDGMDAAIRERGALVEGAVEAVDRFRALGLKVALASSSPHRLIRAVLAAGGIEDRFDAIASAEEEELGKPDPAVYLTTASRLGVAPERCLAIEDSPSGVLAAKRAGMTCVAIVPDASGGPAFHGADLVVRSILELDDRVWEATGTVPAGA